MAARKPKVASTKPAAVPSDAFTAGVEDEAQAPPLATAPMPPSAVSEPSANSEPAAEGPTQPTPVLHAATETVHPGFAMSDDPAIPPQFLRSSPASQAPPPSGAAQPQPGTHPPHLRPAAAVPEVPREPGQVQYEHRIRVLEAFHYQGQVHSAPPWVLRDWVAYADSHDERRNLPPGPALNVPTPRSPTGFTLARKGDYIVRQEILIGPGIPPQVQVEVWEGDAFERLFIPVSQPQETAA